jgi:secondary thiamine-phosphate synthase enzyme
MKIASSDVRARATATLGAVDLTEELRRAVKDSGVTDGLVLAFCAHTTATLVLAEWEDGALDDFRARLAQLVPGDLAYAHDDLERRTQNLQDGHERANGRAHVAQMLVGGSSHVLPIAAGEPAFGEWQRLILAELDEPRERRVTFVVLGQ